MDDVTVYRTWDEAMADMAAGLLAAEGISARKISPMPRSLFPTTMNGLGEIRIAVPGRDARRAAEILAARFSEGENGDDGGDNSGEDTGNGRLA